MALEVSPLSISGRYYRLTNIYKAFDSLFSHFLIFSPFYSMCIDY